MNFVFLHERLCVAWSLDTLFMIDDVHTLMVAHSCVYKLCSSGEFVIRVAEYQECTLCDMR